jgi:RimJ/RimL family protein N-acetyltransferase
LALRPFTAADIPWVYEVSLEPAVSHFVELPSPYRMEDARFFVEEIAIAGSERGRRLELLIEDSAARVRLGRVGLGLTAARRADIGYWVDPKVRGDGGSSKLTVLALVASVIRPVR